MKHCRTNPRHVSPKFGKDATAGLYMRNVAAAALMVLAGMLAGCVAHCPCDATDSQFPAMVATQEQWLNPPTAKGRTIYVFRPHNHSVSAPPVLVLHEYPALSSQCLVFAQRLADQGFTVYVPVLFGDTEGKTGETASIATLFELGASPNWNVIVDEHVHSPITDWLHSLARDISQREHHSIGVIGMCFTGSLPLSLMSEDCVAAPVVCQPATPFLEITHEGRQSLAISNQELTDGIKAAHKHGKKVFFTRYEQDTISKWEKAANLGALLGDLLEDHTIPDVDYTRYNLALDSHATLTHCVETPPAKKLFRELASFLHQHLD